MSSGNQLFVTVTDFMKSRGMEEDMAENIYMKQQNL